MKRKTRDARMMMVPKKPPNAVVNLWLILENGSPKCEGSKSLVSSTFCEFHPGIFVTEALSLSVDVVSE